MQLSDYLSYLHNTSKIIHNDIKGDNVAHPFLLIFERHAFVMMERRKSFLTRRKIHCRCHKEYFHIAPEVIEGTCAQSILSDVYSFGVVIASIYCHIKHHPLKELAKDCLKPVSSSA